MGGAGVELSMQKFAVRPGTLERCHTPPGTKPGPSDDTVPKVSVRAIDRNRTPPEQRWS